MPFLEFIFLGAGFPIISHGILYRGLLRRLVGSSRERADFSRALGEGTHAISDINSMVQFILWIPFGLGVFVLTPLQLFLLPTLHEAYDFVYLFFVHRRRFRPSLLSFVVQHHLISHLGRVLFSLLVLYLIAPEFQQLFFEAGLLYYCCSIFLVAPIALERLLVREENLFAQAVFKTACFGLARFSHLSLFVFACLKVEKCVVHPWEGVAFLLGSATLIVGAEWHSITHGLPRVREAWERAGGFTRSQFT